MKERKRVPSCSWWYSYIFGYCGAWLWQTGNRPNLDYRRASSY